MAIPWMRCRGEIVRTEQDASRSSLGHMAEACTKQRKKRPTARGVWRLALMIIGVIAIVREMRKPRQERVWHGRVADFVPYDFRKPTMERFRETYWNPEGPFLSAKAWGVGWSPNFGAVRRVFSR
jgi:hypothetical protein